MADTKVSALGTVTPVGTDYVYLVDDPIGTAVSKRTTVAEVGVVATENLPTLEPSDDAFTRLGTWDDGTSGIIRPVPSTKIMVRDPLTFNWGASVNNTTTETSILTSTYTIAAGTWAAGTTARVVMTGIAANATTGGPNTFTARMKIGTVTVSAPVFTIPQSAAVGNHSWIWEVNIQVIEFGGTRAVGGWSALISDESLQSNMQSLTGANDTSTIDFTSAKTLDVTFQHTRANSNTKATLLGGYLEIAQDV